MAVPSVASVDYAESIHTGRARRPNSSPKASTHNSVWDGRVFIEEPTPGVE